MLTDKIYPTYNFRYLLYLNKNLKVQHCLQSLEKDFFTFKYGLIIYLVWSLGMVCGMVRNFRTIPHTNPSYHTIFYSMPRKSDKTRDKPDRIH